MREIFHPIISTFLELDLFTEETTIELGYEDIG